MPETNLVVPQLPSVPSLPTEPSVPPVNNALPGENRLNEPSTSPPNPIAVDTVIPTDSTLRDEEKAMGIVQGNTSSNANNRSAPGVTPAKTNTAQATLPATEVGSAGILENKILETIGSH